MVPISIASPSRRHESPTNLRRISPSFQISLFASRITGNYTTPTGERQQSECVSLPLCLVSACAFLDTYRAQPKWRVKVDL